MGGKVVEAVKTDSADLGFVEEQGLWEQGIEVGAGLEEGCSSVSPFFFSSFSSLLVSDLFLNNHCQGCSLILSFDLLPFHP